MTNKYNLFIAFLASLFIYSCQDPIEVELSPTNGQVNVDAWLTDKSEPQVIKLRRVSPYFDASPSPVISGATVKVFDDLGNEFDFTETNESGNYIWTPSAGATLGEVGREFILGIEIDGKQYGATSIMKRTMPIDSLITRFEEQSLGQPEGYYAEVYARDFTGPGDTYWIKTYKNGDFLNKAREITIAYDAGFTAGGGVDGVSLITPIRQSVNRFPDLDDESEDNTDVAPWAIGDSIRVEIHSLNEIAFYFLEQSLTQMTLGDAGLFAEPPSNVPSNIIPITPSDDPADQAVGFFNVASVSEAGYIIQ